MRVDSIAELLCAAHCTALHSELHSAVQHRTQGHSERAVQLLSTAAAAVGAIICETVLAVGAYSTSSNCLLINESESGSGGSSSACAS